MPNSRQTSTARYRPFSFRLYEMLKAAITALAATRYVQLRGAQHSLDHYTGPGQTVVISHNQSGGITAGNVNINAAPEPTLHATQLFANKPANGGYHTRVELRVESPYPPGNLYVGVRAPSMRSAELSPQRAGVVIKGRSGTRPGFAFDNLQQPYGMILLDVYTSDPEKLEVVWNIQ